MRFFRFLKHLKRQYILGLMFQCLVSLSHYHHTFEQDLHYMGPFISAWGVNPTSPPRGTPWGTVLLALSNERGSGCGRQ